jgi:hypothetical protein
MMMEKGDAIEGREWVRVESDSFEKFETAGRGSVH